MLGKKFVIKHVLEKKNSEHPITLNLKGATS